MGRWCPSSSGGRDGGQRGHWGWKGGGGAWRQGPGEGASGGAGARGRGWGGAGAWAGAGSRGLGRGHVPEEPPLCCLQGWWTRRETRIGQWGPWLSLGEARSLQAAGTKSWPCNRA